MELILSLGSLAFVFIIIPIALVIVSCIRILSEYERGVVFRLGRVLTPAKGPGIIFLIPIIDRIEKISIRTITMDIPPQDVMSGDSVTLKVNAVLNFRIVDPVKAIVNVENYLYATTQLAQTHLRSTLGEHTLDEVLKNREKINDTLQQKLDLNTDPWGIKVVGVEIKDVDLPSDMQRAMAKEAEAERERKAKIIAADGELQAATKLKEAADCMAGNSGALQLRYLQTVANMTNKTTVVFPIPMDFFSIFSGLKK